LEVGQGRCKPRKGTKKRETGGGWGKGEGEKDRWKKKQDTPPKMRLNQKGWHVTETQAQKCWRDNRDS